MVDYMIPSSPPDLPGLRKYRSDVPGSDTESPDHLVTEDQLEARYYIRLTTESFREAAKKLFFLVVRPLRGRGG